MPDRGSWDTSSRNRNTITIGRTHGVFAEPTTFGLKLLVYYEEFRRHRVRLDAAARDITVGKISGAVEHMPMCRSRSRKKSARR